MGIEIYRDRPIFYGCGDFLNGYEESTATKHIVPSSR